MLRGDYMSYEIQLDFVRLLLENMYISSCIIDNYQTSIPSTIDLGLRKSLFEIENYAGFFKNSMSNAKPNTIYRFHDEYYCNYIFMRLPDTEKENFFFIGPYLPAMFDEDKITARDSNKNESEILINYYNKLPIIEDDSTLISIIDTFGKVLWGDSQNFSTKYIEYMILDREKVDEQPPSDNEDSDSPFTLEFLENNYNKENILMDAISGGKLQIINSIVSIVYDNGIDLRFSDSLRDRKNYLISLNTLLRKAAEYGHVHPLHTNQMSVSYIKKIENIRTVEHSFHIQREMIRNYCLLVKKHSLKNYSPLIGKVITIISYNLDADLSLKTLAKQLNVNSSYLSALFKKECGCTLTEYLNNKRINHSMSLLQKTDKLIYEIAYESGFQEPNYFIRLFKKSTGKTPSQYRKQMGK